MRARYNGESIVVDPRVTAIGVVRRGEYNISLERAGWWDKLFHGVQLMLWVQVGKKWLRLPYPNMESFEANWSVK